MNEQLRVLKIGALDGETIPPGRGYELSAKPKICRPRQPTDDSRGLHLTHETQVLLRQRLRAAALILLVGFSVFLVRHILGLFWGEPLSPLLLGTHVLVVAVLGWCSLPLCRECEVSMRRLRLTELAVFGLPTLFFLLLQHRVALTEAGRGYLAPPMAFWPLLIFTYAMFIPNKWQRAAIVIGVMALAPMALVVGMMWAYPQYAALMTVGEFAQHLLTLAVASVAAVFGTRLINTLRREAFEAKQFGQYRLIKSMGAGGMGEVYLAEHRMLKRPCVVKLIRPEKAGDPRVLARFEREVQMTARLSHWNTVEVFDYGRTDDGTFFYVMEYLPGLSLDELLAQHGPLSAERVIYLLRQACQALREAHSIGLIHRDIKPGNIFVAQRGGLYDVVKLLDFGLVKPIAEIDSARLTHDGSISGTPLFMSPEQARGHAELDARSDIYSLGAVAYALLSGRAPFEMSNPIDVIIAHDRDPVIPLSRVRSDVPADLEAIVLRCLEKRREDRFQDVASLDDALSHCAAAHRWTKNHAEAWWFEHASSAQAMRETKTIANQLTEQYVSSEEFSATSDEQLMAHQSQRREMAQQSRAQHIGALRHD
jgi:serine/threonine-protein kinase